MTFASDHDISPPDDFDVGGGIDMAAPMAEEQCQQQTEPPHNPEAEAALLGGILFQPDSIDVVTGMVEPDDFYSERNKTLFAAMQRLHLDGKAVDPILLLNTVRANKGSGVDAVYIGQLADAVPSAANIAHYAEVVQTKSRLRKMLQICRQGAKAIEDGGEDDPQRCLASIESDFFALGDGGYTLGPKLASEGIVGVFAEMEKRSESGKEINGLSTGFADLDKITRGLQPGSLYLIAARPSMGKTAFALDLTMNVEERAKRAVPFFSLEMPAEALLTRIMAARSGIDSEEFSSGAFMNNQDKARRAIGAVQRVKDSLLYIDDSPELGLAELRARCRRLNYQTKAVGGIAMVVVDYIGLLKTGGSDRQRKREEQVSALSKGLKRVARELNVPLVVLSQLNRDVEKRVDKRPMLCDLRESGSLEQDADVVMMLYRDAYYNKSSHSKVTELRIEKNRNGRTGMVNLIFDDSTGKFKDYAGDRYSGDNGGGNSRSRGAESDWTAGY